MVARFQLTVFGLLSLLLIANNWAAVETDRLAHVQIARYRAEQRITGVVNGASFTGPITSGSWVSIFGEGLATTTRTWRDDEIVDGVLPAELDGVSVRVNGREAAVFFASPGQLNVQAPDDDALGPVEVEVLRDGAVTARLNAELAAENPGLFAFDPRGRRYPAAVHADGVFVGPEDLFGGAVGVRPVHGGDTILLFGTGFGLTDPPVPSGRVFSGAAPLVSPVKVLIDGREALVPFAGLSGAGLYQFNVVVPDGTAEGDVEVRVEFNGKSSQTGLFLAVRSAPPPGPPRIVISQVYGGGGNQGALFNNDFVELFNSGSSPVDVSGWTVQYASARGSTWQITELLGVILAGQYYLVQEGQGQTRQAPPLPTPDVIGGIPMSNSSGKVALLSGQARLTGETPSRNDIVDFLGYGAATFSEGSTAGGLDNRTAAIRKGEGCVDTDRNDQDFEVGPPSPRNSTVTAACP